VLLVASDLVEEGVEELATGELVEEVVVAVAVVAPLLRIRIKRNS
jgi:hypothetical protein